MIKLLQYLLLCLFVLFLLLYFGQYSVGIEKDEVFDYIVVGAGSAGSLIAYRLAEDLNATILLLEAGPSLGSILDIPVAAPLFHKSPIDWQYETVSQTSACFGFHQNKCVWPMGKIVGGSGRINNMVYARGHPSDYIDWFKDVPFFNYKWDILEYFKKTEDQIGAYINDTKHHSINGPNKVNDLPYTTLAETFLKAIETLGFLISDLNSEFNTGFMQPQVNIKSGERWTIFKQLLQNNKQNVKLRSLSVVNEIFFHDNYEAYAVNYSHFGSFFVVQARKAIILSAGVIGTPKLMMLSGIGDKQHLNEIGIKCKRNLPVGNNLQDHVTTGLDLVLLNTTAGLNIKDIVSPLAAYDYFFNSKGPWTSVGCEVLGMINTDNNSTLKPDLGFMVIPVGATADGGLFLKNKIGINDDTWNGYFSNVLNNHTISVLPIVLHPKSLGQVRLRDKSPISKPLINPNYLLHQNDVRVLLKGIELIKKIINTSHMQTLGARINSNKIAGCQNYEFDTDAYWECYVRHLTLTAYHPVGTCRMDGSTTNSVVNYNFQVIGTNKLYIADASVFPSLTSANINAAVIMMAEKAADAIKYNNFLLENVCHTKEIFIRRLVC